MRLFFAAAVVTALFTASPSVVAAKTFHGKTSQGRSASLTTGADGVPTRGSLRWSIPCRKKGFRATGATGWSPPFTSATADALLDGPKSYRTKLRDGSRARITATLRARRHGKRWTGTMAVRELVSRKGKVVDVCQIKRIRFTVS